MVRDGWIFILPLLALALLCGLAARQLNLWAGWIPAALFFALGLFCAYFFRDPVRVIPADQGLVVSPTDGKVIVVKEGVDPFVGKCREVHIFMNVFNVHIQRSPFTVPSQVKLVSYHPGKFLAANVPKASLENEQNWIGLETGDGCKAMVKQIAGLIARRVVCKVGEGETVQAGQKVGLIRFGSQVDLLLPLNCEVLVKVGDTVKGGETPMARRDR